MLLRLTFEDRRRPVTVPLFLSSNQSNKKYSSGLFRACSTTLSCIPQFQFQLYKRAAVCRGRYLYATPILHFPQHGVEVRQVFEKHTTRPASMASATPSPAATPLNSTPSSRPATPNLSTPATTVNAGDKPQDDSSRLKLFISILRKYVITSKRIQTVGTGY